MKLLSDKYYRTLDGLRSIVRELHDDGGKDDYIDSMNVAIDALIELIDNAPAEAEIDAAWDKHIANDV